MNNRKRGAFRLFLVVAAIGAQLIPGRAAAESEAVASADGDLPLMIALDESALEPGRAEEVSTADSPKEQEKPVQIEEIIVTATKRQESTRTLAGAVTAVSRDRLDETGSSNFADYLSLSP